MTYKNCEHKNCKWYATGTCILEIAKNNEKCKTKMDRKSPLKRLLDNIKILQEANALEAEFEVFKNKRPKNPKNENRRIAGLMAKSIAYLKNNEELIKMSVENFIYLMAKCGVDIEIDKA